MNTQASNDHVAGLTNKLRNPSIRKDSSFLCKTIALVFILQIKL